MDDYFKIGFRWDDNQFTCVFLRGSAVSDEQKQNAEAEVVKLCTEGSAQYDDFEAFEISRVFGHKVHIHYTYQ